MMVRYLVSLFVFSILLCFLANAQFTLDPCRCDAECEDPRVCMLFVPPFDFSPCQPGDESCTCTLTAQDSDESLGIQDCRFDFDCFEGDDCVDTPTLLDEDLRTCVSSCGSDRENCPEPYQKPECDVATAPPKPSKTPKGSKRPKPSKTPSQSPSPALPLVPPASLPSFAISPSMTPNPTLPQPMELPEGSPGLAFPPEATITPELTSEVMASPMLETPEPKPTVKGIGTGLTRDPCMKLADCIAPRRCIKINSPLLDCEPGDEECNCIPLEPPRCERDSDCVEGEQCHEEDNRPGSAGPLCVSTCSIYETEDPEKFASVCSSGPKTEPTTPPTAPTMEPTVEATMEESPAVITSPTPDPICVAAAELEGVEKVFDRDFHAWVLCDVGGSCATPGHMVVWNGEGMMMNSYCDLVGCEKKVMAVNSPRWRAGAVPSKTNGLVYTGFAARFATIAEERVLAAIVRLVV